MILYDLAWHLWLCAAIFLEKMKILVESYYRKLEEIVSTIP